MALVPFRVSGAAADQGVEERLFVVRREAAVSGLRLPQLRGVHGTSYLYAQEAASFKTARSHRLICSAHWQAMHDAHYGCCRLEAMPSPSASGRGPRRRCGTKHSGLCCR